MKKFLKIFLKVTGIALLLILILLIVLPIVFKGKIMEIAKTEINKSVNAKVDFADLDLSFIKAFPNASVGLEKLVVVGKGDFEKDTLVSFNEFRVVVNLMSIIKGSSYDVKSILLDSPRIKGIVLADGKANWDIAMPDTVKEVVDTTKSEPVKFNVKLKKFEIRNADIAYIDYQGGMEAQINKFNFILKGDLSDELTSLDIKTSIAAITFKMGLVKYLNQASFKFNAVLDADLKNMVFTMKENEIGLNDLSLSIIGKVKMPTDKIDMDLTFKTNKADFKGLLSLVPAVYMKDFQSVKTSGSLKLDGYVKGILADSIQPNAGVNLVVENAMFKYPDLPKSVDNININVKVDYNGVTPDSTIVDVNKFHFDIASNPFDINLHLRTPMSDMQINGAFKGKIDFTTLTDVVPLDSTTIKGLLAANVEMMGRMSTIEKGQYEDFKADGTIDLTNFEFITPDFPQGVLISKANLKFSPKYVDLSAFDCKIGKSDIHLNGKLEKFIPYVFSNDTIVGALVFNSNLLDLNEFMGGESTVDTTAADTTQLSVVEVPGNINFKLNANLKKLNYDKLVISDVLGVIIVRNSRLNMQNLSMNMLNGSMKITGEYNTVDVRKPSVDLNLDMKDFDIPSTFKAFSSLDKLAPVAKDCKGKISIAMQYRSELDQHMSPVLSTTNGGGTFSSKSIELSNSETFNKIADLLKNDKWRKLTLSDFKANFEIKDGRVYVEPFDTKVGSSTWNIGGDHGLDQTLNYAISASIPSADLGSGVSSLISGAASLLKTNAGENININFKIGGTTTKPVITPTIKGGSAKDAVKDIVNEKKEEIKENLSAKAEKLIADAQKEADKIKATAKTTADAVRKEAYANADKVEAEAKNQNILMKKAAKKTADGIRKQGDDKADKIIKEADVKADAIMKKAKEEADKLK